MRLLKISQDFHLTRSGVDPQKYYLKNINNKNKKTHPKIKHSFLQIEFHRPFAKSLKTLQRTPIPLNRAKLPPFLWKLLKSCQAWAESHLMPCDFLKCHKSSRNLSRLPWLPDFHKSHKTSVKAHENSTIYLSSCPVRRTQAGSSERSGGTRPFQDWKTNNGILTPMQ